MTRRYAICLGLTRVDPDAYGGWDGDCPGCDRDAARFARACHDRGFDGVSVLVNGAADSVTIEHVFLQAVAALGDGDLLVLYCSGHGGQQRDTSGDETDGHDETLCWWDGEVLDDAIAEYLAEVPAGVRVLMVTDTCNSGTNYRGRRRRRPTPVRLTARATAGMQSSLLHLGGCADGRYSYGDDAGGVFTNALLDALARARKPLTYAEWFSRAAARMPRNQVPVLSTWGEPDYTAQEALT